MLRAACQIFHRQNVAPPHLTNPFDFNFFGALHFETRDCTWLRLQAQATFAALFFAARTKQGFYLLICQVGLVVGCWRLTIRIWQQIWFSLKLFLRLPWHLDRQLEFSFRYNVHLLTLCILFESKLSSLKLPRLYRMTQFGDLVSGKRRKKGNLSEKVDSTLQLNFLDNLRNALPRFDVKNCHVTVFGAFYRCHLDMILSYQGLLTKHVQIWNQLDLLLR